MVCGEALANGIPVLASRRTAAIEFVASGVNADVFDPDDEMALASLLKGLQDSDVVARLSKAAYARYWAAAPTLDAHVGSLVGIYSNLLGPIPR